MSKTPSQVPSYWIQIEGKIDRFIGDGIYDGEPVYAAVLDHSPGVRVIIPPRKDAARSPSVRDREDRSICLETEVR